MSASATHGSWQAYTPARAGFVGDAYTPADETADLVSLNMAVSVRSVSDMRDNPTLNRSGFYIFKIHQTSLLHIIILHTFILPQ